jgi:hypothetical protein
MMIFRPWPIGTFNNTTCKVGLSNTINSSVGNGLYWRYSNNIAPTSVWHLVQDGSTVYSLPVTTQFVNTWLRITILKTGGNAWTSTFTDLSTNTTYTTSGSGIIISQNLFAGGIITCVSGSTNKYLDIDYVQFQTNSSR